MSIVKDQTLLSFCLNVFPCGNIQELYSACFKNAIKVYNKLDALRDRKQNRNIGLWLSADVARDLLTSPEKLTDFKNKLAADSLKVTTLNGFPYGVFHSERIKEKVYQPNWSEDSRVEYTINLAKVLAELVPARSNSTISTIPISYRKDANKTIIEKSILNLTRTLEELAKIHQESSKKTILALEPEPDCLLDSTQTIIGFWQEFIAPLPDSIKPYLGICLDTAHSSTLFESPLTTLQALSEDNIPVVKMQLAAVPEASKENAQHLANFQDDVYLHQSCVKATTSLKRYEDLPANITLQNDEILRTHYHLPLSISSMHSLLTTTSDINDELIDAATTSGCQCFELEIYTLSELTTTNDQVTQILAEDLHYLIK